MRYNIACLFLFISLSVTASRIDTIDVYSGAMDKNIKTTVITPDNESVTAFPVVYLLHGYGGNEMSWIHSKANIPLLADQFQVIIVCPDGKNSWYWDSPKDSSYKYETFISKELITYIDFNYPTIPSKEKRAITGLSMGGHGAMWNAIRHTDIFGAVGSMSGGVDIRPFPKNWEMNKQLGEAQENQELWENHTVINQLNKLKKEELAMIIDCGTDDFFFTVNNNFHQALLDKKLDHDYIVRPGKHNWEYWVNAIVYQLLFFKRHFDS
ncbi:alpha/beta hydrolase family protein [Bacteroides sp. 224]|uniref:alpha/beta hydrolase n=1 Tax=Bacteroides sp. 224 TaxID=2302936 RepID=UPI0013D42034|nr:alpha/beta hydrolase family protein [Bacteroides sp. 224]NDV64359.1 esterase family protein [Bacteroides sp. 224]